MALKWKAKWIGFRQHPSDDLGVFVFQRVFDKPAGGLTVKVSADQRYRLLLNGQFVGEGPQRGDLQHWFYESYDLSHQLVEGENRLEAIVWNFGRYAPMAQHTYRLAFVLQGDGVSTPDGWSVARVPWHRFEMLHSQVGPFYIDVGPGEEIDLSAEVNLEWKEPWVVSHVLERGEWAGDSPWSLVPRSLPAMSRERWAGRPLVVDRRTNERKPFDTLLVHPGEKALLDFGELLTAYPELAFEGDTGASVVLTYVEGLFDKQGRKGNREDVKGKEAWGYQDRFVLGGAEPRKVFSPLWWRTWRYLQIEADRPVRLASASALATGYPYTVESVFEGSDPWIERIWEVGVRTAKRCAGETYFDCPYYEQLQYVGDTRIQALIQYHLSRDRRLQRNAVEQFAWSLTPIGITTSRYPSRVQQIIPPFSLFWLLMLRDQVFYDATEQLPDIVSPQTLRRVLRRFRCLQKEPLPFWMFADWVPEWPMGVPPGGGRSIVHQALLELATRAALEVAAAKDGKDPSKAKPQGWQDYGSLGHELCKAGVGLAKSSRRGVDDSPSEHAEALIRCHYAMRGLQPVPWPAAALEQAQAAKCTYYFQYYKHLAMAAGDPQFDYVAELEPWKEMIRNGLTTFAEAPEPVRSDCHAWSAHPVLGFFQVVAGVTSQAPEWTRVKIQPRPGRLNHFHARLAHPAGDLVVAWDGNHFIVDSPVPFEFDWRGKSAQFPAGSHRF